MAKDRIPRNGVGNMKQERKKGFYKKFIERMGKE